MQGDVLVVEEAFASFLDVEYHNSYCHHCFKYCLALIPCFRCSMAMFCSNECRKESWEKYHHIDCYALTCFTLSRCERIRREVHIPLIALVTASSAHKSLTEFYRWMQSVEVEVTKKEFDMEVKYVSLDYRRIYNLSCDNRKGAMLVYIMQAVDIFTFLDTCTGFFKGLDPADENDIKMFIGGLIFKHLRIMSRNSFGIFGFEAMSSVKQVSHCKEIGAAVYAVSNLLNHSCDPNVFWTVCNGKMIIFACHSIQKGEQLFTTYGYSFCKDVREVRMAALMTSSYDFECRCQACKEHWPLLGNLPHFPTLKCKHCGTDLPATNAKINSRCTKCRKVTNTVMVIECLHKDIVKLYKQPKESAEKRFSTLAEILQCWDKSLKRPWHDYYLHQFRFLKTLYELSFAKDF